MRTCSGGEKFTQSTTEEGGVAWFVPVTCNLARVEAVFELLETWSPPPLLSCGGAQEERRRWKRPAPDMQSLGIQVPTKDTKHTNLSQGSQLLNHYYYVIFNIRCFDSLASKLLVRVTKKFQQQSQMSVSNVFSSGFHFHFHTYCNQIHFLIG